MYSPQSTLHLSRFFKHHLNVLSVLLLKNHPISERRAVAVVSQNREGDKLIFFLLGRSPSANTRPEEDEPHGTTLSKSDVVLTFQLEVNKLDGVQCDQKKIAKCL